MSEWVQRTTADLIREGVLEIGDGYRAKNIEFAPSGGLPFVRVGDVGVGGIRVDGIDELPVGERSRYEPKVSRPGDSLITMKGTVGRVAFVTSGLRPFVYSPQISYWRSHDKNAVHPRWLRYWLEGPEFLAQASATKGATDMADYINLRDQRQMQIRLPPADRQERIADVLGAVDDLIENKRRRVEVLEEMARAIYREWFVHFRYPGHENVPLVDSDLGPIPDGWVVRPLGEIAFNQDRRRRPMSKAQRAERRGKFPYYGAAKLIDWVDGWIFDGEYLLFAEDGSVQTPDGFPVLQLVEGQFWANNHTHILEGGEVSTRFLYLASLSTPISGYVTGAAQPKITQANLNRIPVVVGTPDIQRAFDGIIDPLFDEWRQLQAAIAPLASLRNLLLPKLVTGQIDVSSLDLDALLERESV